MSYLDVNILIKNLLEDSHNRKYQKLKITSSKTRNDLEPVKDGKTVQGNRNRKTKPNDLGEFENKEDANKSSESNATLRQNLDNEKLNRLALKRKLPIGVKNPKNPGIHLGVYSSIENDNSTKPAYVKAVQKRDPNQKTPIDQSIKASSNTVRNTLYINKNAHRTDDIDKTMSKQDQDAIRNHIELGKTKAENHEKDHIMDMDYVKKHHGKKAAREMELKNRMDSYNANKANADYNTKLDNPHLYHPKAIKTSKENSDKAQDAYLHNPTEYNAHIVAANTKNPDDKNVVERMSKSRHNIMDKGVKGKKIPDIDKNTYNKAINQQPF